MPPTTTAFSLDRGEIRRQDYSLSDEQGEIRQTFARFFGQECGSDLVRESEPLGYDEVLWKRVTELGAASLRLPEAEGGVAGSLIDLVLIAEEAGRAAAPLPLAEVATAVTTLSRAGATDVAAAGADGSLVVTIALRPLDSSSRQLLPAGAVASAIVALDGDELVLIERDRPGDHVGNLGTAPLALFERRDSDRRTTLALGGAARSLYADAISSWRLMTAAALVGAGKQALTEAVEFAKTRIVSGVPIGALQGVSHPLADAEARLSGSRNLLRRAAWFQDNEPRVRPELAPMAFVHADRAAAAAAATALHMQGGFGFTLESDVTLYFRRAKGWSVVGDPARARVEVGELLARASGQATESNSMKGVGHGLQPA